jgi:hypothetical protein
MYPHHASDSDANDPAELIVAESRAEENYSTTLISSVVQVSELQRSNVLPLFTSCYYS